MDRMMDAQKKKFRKCTFIFYCMLLILCMFMVGFGGGIASAEDPIVITTAEELDAIRADLTGHYVLGADIDLDVAPYNEGTGWEAIGDYWNNSFSGTFDGKGYTIKGLTIDRSTADVYSAYATGLFGHAKGTAKFSNVNLENVNIIGKSNTGALVGEIGNGGLIENVSVTGTVTGIGKVGGVVGWLSNAKIKNSHANVTVTGGDSHNTDIGGLVGQAGGEGAMVENSTSKGIVQSSGRNVGGLVGVSGGDIKDSSSTANVKSTKTETANAGGLVGNFTSYGDISNSFATGDVEAIGNNGGGLVGMAGSPVGVKITNSYATGTVVGKDNIGGFIGLATRNIYTESYATGDVFGENNVGGFVGELTGEASTIQKVYATGTVTATGDSAGGLVGKMHTNSTVKDSYARGSVAGTDNVGSVIGENLGSTVERAYGIGHVDGGTNIGGFVGKNQLGKYTANFYDDQTTGQSDTTGGTPKSTSEMKTKSTFKGWNFSSTWKLENNDYPTFRATPHVQLKDINNHWANEQINEAVDRGFFTGYEDETFRPDNPITRAEFAVIIDRAIDFEGSGGVAKPLRDINTHWAKEAIEKAQKAGIVTGYEDGTFRPNNRVSRVEIAAMVARALQLDPKVTGSTDFSDDSQIPDWAKGYVAIMREEGIITGRQGNKFVPAANTTRAEGAVILLRSVD